MPIPAILSYPSKNKLTRKVSFVTYVFTPIAAAIASVTVLLFAPEVRFGADEQNLGRRLMLPHLLHPRVLHVAEGDLVDDREADDEALGVLVA